MKVIMFGIELKMQKVLNLLQLLQTRVMIGSYIHHIQMMKVQSEKHLVTMKHRIVLR